MKNGDVIDPANGRRGIMDVAFQGGKVAEVSQDIPAKDAAEVFDARGKLVTPGLVDLHCHFYYGVTSLARDPRTELMPTGVTTAVDAGTAGASNYFNLREFIIKPAVLHLYAFLNIASLGLLTLRFPQLSAYEMAFAENAAKIVSRNKDTVVGIKVRLPGHGEHHETALPLLERTVEAANLSDARVMVHIDGGIPIETLMAALRPGDIITHCFQGHEPTLIGADGRAHPAVREAIARGIILDVAPAGMNHYSWRVAEAVARDGLWPHVIASDYSTDVRGAPHGFMRNLPESMSMMLSLGMPLQEVVRAATITPAEVIGRGAEHGTLSAGRCGDTTVLEMQEVADDYPDMEAASRTLTQVLAPVLTVKSGRIAWARGAHAPVA